MAALDFPVSPTDGQIYGNWVYNTAKGAWKAKPLTPGQAQPSATPPANPSNGDQWYNTIDGVLYIYYNDGNSSQWVESRSAITSDGYYSPNYIINGGFDIWQRGTSGFFFGGAYNADRWAFYSDGSGATRAITQQTFTPGAAPVSGYEGQFFWRYSQTVAGSGGTVNVLIHKVEDVRTLAGQTATISFWARADANRTIVPQLYQNFGSGGSAQVGGILTGTANVTQTWQRFSFTAAIPSITGKTVGANSYLELDLYLGSANAVQTLDIWGVQLELGSVATPFRRNANSIQGELAACQRYYLRLTTNPDASSKYTIWGMGPAENATTVKPLIVFPVLMRTAPTTLEWSGSAGAYQVVNQSFIAATGTLLIESNYSSQYAAMLNIPGSFTAGTFYRFGANNMAGAYIGFSAEL